MPDLICKWKYINILQVSEFHFLFYFMDIFLLNLYHLTLKLYKSHAVYLQYYTLCLKIIPKFHKTVTKMKRQVKHLETLKILGIEFCKDYFG